MAQPQAVPACNMSTSGLRLFYANDIVTFAGDEK